MDRTKTMQCLRRILMLAGLMVFGGCRICADCEDLAYPAYGGVWHRTIRDSGRVGSLFDPAGGLAYDLASRDQPESADELERRRYEMRDDDDDSEKPEEDEPAEIVPTTPEEEEDRLRQRQEELRDRKLEDIEVPEDQFDKQLEEINRRVIPGEPTPPIL